MTTVCCQTHVFSQPVPEPLSKKNNQNTHLPPESLVNIGLRDQRALLNAGNYIGAVALGKKTLTIAKRNLPEGHELVVQALISLGNDLSTSGDFEGALHVFQESKELAQQNKHTLLEGVINGDVGALLYGHGDYDEALLHLLKALEIKELTFGADHLETAITLDNIGITLQRMGHAPEAIDFTTRAVKIFENYEEKDDLSKAEMNLANALMAAHRLAEARSYAQKSLDLNVELHGKGSPETSSPLLTLGIICRRENNNGCAEKSYLAAVNAI